MNNYLILRTLISPYGDTTKGSVLSHSELDDNFIYLKGNIIYTAITDNGLVTLKKYNGEDLVFSGGTGGGGTGGGGDSYWISGSTGSYSLKTINDSGLDATGNYAIASGYNTLASGNQSSAEGEETVAQGNSSHAEGKDTFAQNDYSHAEGFGTTAQGSASHAEGNHTIAEGDYSHAEGMSDSTGTLIARGIASHAEGFITLASGNYSHSEGQNTTAAGTASHSEGNLTFANGEYSHVGGFGYVDGSSTAYVVADGDVSFVHQFSDGMGQLGFVDYGAFSDYSSILGGKNHYIDYGSTAGAIMGGYNHLLYGNSLNSGIFGGDSNLLIDTWNGVIIGGTENGTIQADGSAIVGGYNNLIDAYLYSTAPYAFIGGGYNNRIWTGGGPTGEASAIIGGNGNGINGDNEYVGIYNSFQSTATSQNTSAIISSYQSTINDRINSGSYNNVIIGAYNSNIEANGMSYISILGGANNNIYQNTSFGSVVPNYSVIIGGDTNRIEDSDTATIINGFQNFIEVGSKQSTIINGQNHTITSSQFSAIIGGNDNGMTDSDGSAIIGGSQNNILSDGSAAFTRYYNAILGGTGNTINNGELCFIMGGYQNVIPYGTVGSVILGGDSITANSNNTVFVQRLNIKYAQNDNLTTKLLTIDNNGLIKYRDVSSISGGTGGGGTGTTIDLYWASGTTGNFSVKANNGSTTDATNDYALAINKDNLASGLYSFAGGLGSEAKAESSVALGNDTEAFGKYSFAGGDRTKSSGETSFVWSKQSTAFGNRTVVLGGSGIAGVASDTVYVPYFNISSAITNNDLTSILVRESNGDVKIKTLVSITGGTFSNGTITFKDSTGGTAFSVTNLNNFGNGITATSVTTTAITTNTITATSVTAASITATTISATTYLGLPADKYVTGATYNDKNTFTFKNTTGGTFDVLFNKVSGLTVNGDITFTGQSNNPVYNAGSGVVVGAQTEITLDFKNSCIQTVTLTGLTKFNTPLNIKDGAIYTLIVKQNATGGNNVNWYTPTFKWENGTFPGLTTTANAVDLITFISDGTSLYGLSAKNFS